MQNVVAAIAVEDIIAGTGIDPVGATSAMDDIGAGATVGANALWLMPVFPVNDEWNLPDACDNLGSPYAVRDYLHVVDLAEGHVAALRQNIAALLRQSGLTTALRLLEAGGAEVVVPATQTCCGQPMANSGCHADA